MSFKDQIHNVNQKLLSFREFPKGYTVDIKTCFPNPLSLPIPLQSIRYSISENGIVIAEQKFLYRPRYFMENLIQPHEGRLINHRLEKFFVKHGSIVQIETRADSHHHFWWDLIQIDLEDHLFEKIVESQVNNIIPGYSARRHPSLF